MERDPAVSVTEVGPPSYEDGPVDPHAEVLDEPAGGAATAGADGTPLGAPAATDTSARPSEQAYRRWRFLPRTLANRLVVGVVALVVVLVVAISAATYGALRSFLLSRLDQQVGQASAANSHTVQRCFDTQGLQCSAYRPSQGFAAPQKQWFTVLDRSARPVVSIHSGNPHPDLVQMQLSPGQAQAIVADPDRTRTLTTTDGATIRVTGQVVSDTGAGDFVVVTGLSMADVTGTMHQLLLLELGIGGGAVVVAFLATAYGVRLSLRPLYRVTRTARDVTAELSPDGAGLDRRVPVTHAEADTEAGQLAESVNTLLGAVETQFAARVESEERMRQFLADASHELRTPLTSIRGYAELARMRRANGAGGAESSDADTLDRIEHEGTRMSRLVEDLLMLARSDQGAAPQREPVNAGELVEDAVEGARAAYPDRQIDVVVPAPVTVYGDRDQLLRVLRNLITNAAVHTRPGGPIRVSATSDGGGVVLRVDDSGPGLPPEEAAHVFERFWRADKARSRARGGTGLGMAIVASIVAAHGGTVRFDSSVESGSTVTVRLPAAPTHP